jgi:hypothetical protein
MFAMHYDEPLLKAIKNAKLAKKIPEKKRKAPRKPDDVVNIDGKRQKWSEF